MDLILCKQILPSGGLIYIFILCIYFRKFDTSMMFSQDMRAYIFIKITYTNYNCKLYQRLKCGTECDRYIVEEFLKLF